MRLIITKNVGAWAAAYLRESINNFEPTVNKNFILGLPTGGTALDFYKNLIQLNKKQQLSFKHVTTFNMDEYINLDKNHPQSYWTYMHQNFFNHIDIDLHKVNIPNGNAEDIKLECLNYEKKINQAGGINIFFGGLGENGHIAFNEPFSSFASKTRDKELNENTRLANSRFFDNDINQVPKSAITVGIDTLLQSKEVVLMVCGNKKAKALQLCIEGAVSHMVPASVLQMHKKAIIVADEEACEELKLVTYKFFNTLKDEYSHVEDLIN